MLDYCTIWGYACFNIFNVLGYIVGMSLTNMFATCLRYILSRWVWSRDAALFLISGRDLDIGSPWPFAYLLRGAKTYLETCMPALRRLYRLFKKSAPRKWWCMRYLWRCLPSILNHSTSRSICRDPKETGCWAVVVHWIRLINCVGV